MNDPHAHRILYTTTEAAYQLSVCRQTILKYIEQGYLPAKRQGRKILIHHKDLENIAKNDLPSVWGNDKPWPCERAKRRA
jgi:excisionase family DNA binding protein